MIDRDAVWLITGCSSGLGRALAEQVLWAGYRVVVTARDPSAVADIVEKGADRALAIALDVTGKQQISAAIGEAEARFGAVDVLVNNAGYGYFAALEEGEEADVRAMFATNVFGPWQVANAVLPGMRKRGRGHIVNISSVGGLVTFPAVGFYHMAKFALEGFSETLAKEVAPFSINVTVVEPGAFRTEFRGSSMVQSRIRLPDYAETAGKARDNLVAAHGKQQGDPALGARAIIKAVEAEKPPLHLVVGGDALDLIRKKTRSTNYRVEGARI
jgi:NAD(P)-dependent dehydrogenase (short-subunit alcohol dehydrogenase family)